VAKQTPFQPDAIDRTIRSNLRKLAKPGVLTVRPGYEITGDQLTGKQAIVATVHTKRGKSELPKADLLPDKIGKYPVDVREASAYHRLRAIDPASAAVAMTYGRPEDREPDWPNEREMPSGELLTSAKSQTSKKFAISKKTQPAAHQALAAAAQKPPVPGGYSPQGCPPLSRMPLNNATITTVVSPDAGLKTLSSFLSGTKKSLVIGMYDFTSGPILQDFISDLSGTNTLQMVLDSPAPNGTRNQTDWQTVQQLNSALNNRAKIARALVRTDTFASEWLFPSAYHIKVIVRDGGTTWLSSGNLNNSNEPDLSNPPTTEDRDWHVIIEDQQLAQIFTAYLNYDYNVAVQHQTPNPIAVEKAIEDAEEKKGENMNPPVVKPSAPLVNPVAAETFNNVNTFITPLLTPDNLPNGDRQYLTNITDLINSAEESIYIQLQYIESSAGNGNFYEQLLQTIDNKVKAGLDVKLIESQQFGLKWAEKMKAVGVDLTDNIFLQSNVHNKGFVIDHKTVVVSSQNFSPAGVHDNRDAGLIIENPGIAGYYENVFLSDLKTKTKPASAVSATKTTNTGTGKKGTGSTSTSPKKKPAPKKQSQNKRKPSPRQPKKSRRKP
jgi:phosphatidylserine/phosphatidylglycerophosphate/cardiolipin synthase-like enzyme